MFHGWKDCCLRALKHGFDYCPHCGLYLQDISTGAVVVNKQKQRYINKQKHR